MKLQRKKGPDGQPIGNFFIVRRVPKMYASVETRKQLWISLNTDSLKFAQKKAPGVWREMVRTWEARLAGDTTEAEARYEAAKRIAKSHGFTYLPIEQVVDLPVEQIVSRVNAAHDRTGKPNLLSAAALLGTVPKPTVTVSTALNDYWKLARGKIRNKSDDQIRRWKNPRKKAIRNFIEVCGDYELGMITRDVMLDFREWLNERVDSGQITASTANKELIHLTGILRFVNKKKGLELNLPLSDLHIEEVEEPKVRPAFSTEWIRDKILAPGALDGLNKEARVLLLGMINTGYRPSEACVLTSQQIVLDHDVPHISIEPIGRSLKTPYARRKIPLLGVSLEAFKECPDGFPRYAARANVSPTVAKFLRENRLFETEDHTFYSLRHSFQERMLVHDVDDRIRRDIFGHRLTEDRYGKVSLEKMRDVLMPVAL